MVLGKVRKKELCCTLGLVRGGKKRWGREFINETENSVGAGIESQQRLAEHMPLEIHRTLGEGIGLPAECGHRHWCQFYLNPKA